MAGSSGPPLTSGCGRRRHQRERPAGPRWRYRVPPRLSRSSFTFIAYKCKYICTNDRRPRRSGSPILLVPITVVPHALPASPPVREKGRARRAGWGRGYRCRAGRRRARVAGSATIADRLRRGVFGLARDRQGTPCGWRWEAGPVRALDREIRPGSGDVGVNARSTTFPETAPDPGARATVRTVGTDARTFACASANSGDLS